MAYGDYVDRFTGTLRRRANAAEAECRTDDADIMLEAADKIERLADALAGLEISGLLGRLESNASGMPEWEAVHRRVKAARAAIRKEGRI